MSKQTMPIVSDCPECQAIEDGKAIFLAAEQAAIAESIAPDRMLRALREAVVHWATITRRADMIDDSDIDRLAGMLEHSLQRSLHGTGQHLH